MVFHGFWKNLEKPVIGLSPMDGVTDAACRLIQAVTAKPDVMFTEFITTEGLFYRPAAILPELTFHEIERPVVAQIYGPNPDDFYRATLIVCALGFDGVDINMGCPSKAVVKRGCGAKLITLPEVALQIIRGVQRGIAHWCAGISLEEGGISEEIGKEIERMNFARTGERVLGQRRPIPFSVKTRIGYGEDVLNEWIPTLLSENPAVIALHGRTLKQMYAGNADWEAIGRAAEIIHKTGTLCFGNGDVRSREEALQRVRETNVDGVLIGRAAIGNPWIFSKTPQPVLSEDRIAKALEHAGAWESLRGNRFFRKWNRHLNAYLKGFEGASLFRQKAMEARSFPELREILTGGV